MLGISSPATPNSVLDAIEKLPSGDSTQTFGKLCLLAAGPSSRRVLKEFVNTNNIILDDYWIANNDLNITKLAIAGHLFFLLPPEELTSLGVNVMKEYRRSLGGSKNIIEFGRNGSLLGNKWRTDILKRYAPVLMLKSGFLVGLVSWRSWRFFLSRLSFRRVFLVTQNEKVQRR